MEKKELKKIMTKLAKGEISQKEVQLIINPKKRAPQSPVQEFKGKSHARKRKTKLKEVK